MHDSNEIIDRESERSDLLALSEQPGPTLAVLYGRRRVGKTFLLNHVWPEARRFYFVAAEATPELNRRELLREMGRWSGRTIEPEDYPTWRTVFRLLLELDAPEPRAVILDEYQYLKGGKQEEIDSQLAAVWEEYKSRRGPHRPFVLALCGSMVRVMERLDAAGSPLHGRLDWKHRLEPFDYYDAGRMLSFSSLQDRAWGYGIWGGVPRYLASVRPGESLGEAAARTVLAPRGDVRTQLETVIEQEQGLRKIREYKTVLAAIGSGETERNGIAQRTGLANDSALRLMLDKLVELGYVDARRNFGAPANTPVRYRISDPALRFHYEVVLRYRSELETNRASEVWDEHVLGEMPSYMGHIFEVMVGQAYHRLRKRLSLPMVADLGRWEGKDRDGQSTEVDVVVGLSGGGVMSGAVKATRKPMGPHVHVAHLDALRRLAASGHRWAHQALDPEAPLLYASASGFTSDFAARAAEDGHRVVCWTLEDMYAPGL